MSKSTFIFILIITVACFIFICIDPIPQDLEYHYFADKRSYLGIKNFADVFSNALFAIFGFMGLYHCCRIVKRVAVDKASSNKLISDDSYQYPSSV